MVKIERPKTVVQQEVPSSAKKVEQTTLITTDFSDTTPSFSDIMPTERNIIQNQNSETNLVNIKKTYHQYLMKIDVNDYDTFSHSCD
jgi:hypothetical protein